MALTRTAALGAIALVCTAGAAADAEEVCHATGEACFLGIDPDVYQMPLYGEIIQAGNERICATTSWASLAPEAFDIDFMRSFWQQLSPDQRGDAEAAAALFVTTHWGPPAVPPDDLAHVATPAYLPGEVFRSLEARTTRIEFEVPKTDFEKLGWEPASLPVSFPPDPNPEVPWKLRGWYIRGDGIVSADREDPFDDGDSVIHPLIIVSPGFPYAISHDGSVGGIEVGRQMRRTVTYLVARGFDVLFFDKRGHGYSEGFVEGMGEDIFRALDQLERGRIVDEGIVLELTIITPEGRRLTGDAAARERLLGDSYTARTKPVVLRGFSYGSSQLQKAMAMNTSDLPVEYRFTRNAEGEVVVDEKRTPRGSRGYDFRGIVAISGFPGSIKYETVPYFLALDALASTVGHNGGVVKSSVYESMRYWPAFLGLYATNDFETGDGAIDAYNERLRGFKDIRMVTGHHFGLASREVDTFFAEETARFARRTVLRKPPTDNRRSTSYAQEVCQSERVVMDPETQSILAVPSPRIRAANRRVDRILRRWVLRQGESRDRR